MAFNYFYKVNNHFLFIIRKIMSQLNPKIHKVIRSRCNGFLNLVQQTLKRSGEKMSQCEDQEKLKVLLRLLIKEITMDEARNIESIRIQINDDIINFLSEKEDVPKRVCPLF